MNTIFILHKLMLILCRVGVVVVVPLLTLSCCCGATVADVSVLFWSHVPLLLLLVSCHYGQCHPYCCFIVYSCDIVVSSFAIASHSDCCVVCCFILYSHDIVVCHRLPLPWSHSDCCVAAAVPIFLVSHLAWRCSAVSQLALEWRSQRS